MNWKRVLPLTGSLLLLILIIMLVSGCYYSGMVHVKAGSFEMGCDDGQYCEKPVHTVRLHGFWIDEYEVTNFRYVLFLNVGLKKGWVHVVQKDDSGGSYSQVEINGHCVLYMNHPAYSWDQITYLDDTFAVVEGKENFPVCVSWYGAMAYCEAYDKRLPTEAEWEFAAKGGHLSRFISGGVGYFRYSGSDNPDTVAWHRYNSSSSQLVGQLGANELGIFDMSGNLREWTNDWCDLNYYSDSPQENPQGPPEPVYSSETGMYLGKVMRGGSWYEISFRSDEDQDIEYTIDSYRVRVTKRDYGCPCNLSNRTGFRCAAPEKTFPLICLPFSTLVKPQSKLPDLWPTGDANPEKFVE